MEPTNLTVAHSGHGPLLSVKVRMLPSQALVPHLVVAHCYAPGCPYKAGAESEGKALRLISRHYLAAHYGVNGETK